MNRRIFFFILAFATLNVSYSQNIAENKTTTASSGTSSLAVDGDLNSRWESDISDPQWWSVDLGATYTIGQVIIKWEGAYATNYKIQISPDNTNWTDIYTETAGNGGTDNLLISGTGQYLRYYGTARATVYGHSFWELEVYEAISATKNASLSDLTLDGATISGFSSNTFNYDVVLNQGTTMVPDVMATTSEALANAVITPATTLPGETIIVVTSEDTTTQKTYTIKFNVDRENLATNKTATASSETQAASNAFDGVLDTRWESAIADPQWIYVDFESALDIDGVQLNWEGAFASKYTIDVSNDATNWTTVYTEDAGNGGIDDISFASTSARYVRMYGTERGTAFAYSLYEFEVYGKAILSTESFEAFSFSIYPNPANNLINFKANTRIDRIQIFNLLGKKVMEDTPKSLETNMDISWLEKGIYLVKIHTEGKQETRKIIKN